jgi:Helix-turn-helix domain
MNGGGRSVSRWGRIGLPRDLATAIRVVQAALAQRSAPRKQPSPAWHAEAEQRYRAGETLREVGAALGHSYGTVYNVLAARGVPMRHAGKGGKDSHKRRQAAGREGGRATFAKHGREHYVAMGRRGKEGTQ